MGIVFTIIIVAVLVYFFFNMGQKKTADPYGQAKDPNNPRRNPKRGGGSYGKWVGGGLGWAFGGPIGGILGFVFGSMFDSMKNGTYEYVPGETQTRPADFSLSLLVLAAAVMKADNRIMKSELDYVKQFLVRQFGTEAANEQVRVLGEIIKQDINVYEVSGQIKQFMEYASRLQLIHFLFGISSADGHHHPREIETIELICDYLGVSRADYKSIKSMFIKDTSSAYNILEVAPGADDDEVKKAYHKMAIKYHPDKVSHLGADVQKAAKEKFQQLQHAYDQVKKERGIK